MWTSTGDCINDAIKIGALYLLPFLLSCIPGRKVAQLDRASGLLFWLAQHPSLHRTEQTALAPLIALGIDPTFRMDINSTESGRRSAQHLAREFARLHPLPPLEQDALAAAAGSTVQQRRERLRHTSLLRQFCDEQLPPTSKAKEQIFDQWHSRFLHSLLAEWRAHSSAVRLLLYAASPAALTRDVANICAHYLDLD